MIFFPYMKFGTAQALLSPDTVFALKLKDRPSASHPISPAHPISYPLTSGSQGEET